MGPDHSVPPEPRSETYSADASVDPVIRRRLRSAADEDGFLPFDRFVEIALYEPGRGFYDRASTRLGRAGDFYTAAHLHGLLGETLAAHIREMWEGDDSPGRFQIIEVGPGDGSLAADIRAGLIRTTPRSAEWEYLLVERSAAFRSAIETALGPPGEGRLPWRFAPSLASVGPMRGVVLANELLDAFPFRRFMKRPDDWAELGVRVGSEGPLASAVRLAKESDGLPELPDRAPEGTVLEISIAMEGWIRELADHLAAGQAILIDFGELEEGLLRRGGAGTLEAIREHRPVDPLSQPGTADLSAWVNFTRVRRVAQRAGFREDHFGPLSEALGRWGIAAVQTQLEKGKNSVQAVELHLAMKGLLFGFDTFKVLELSPGRVSV